MNILQPFLLARSFIPSLFRTVYTCKNCSRTAAAEAGGEPMSGCSAAEAPAGPGEEAPPPPPSQPPAPEAPSTELGKGVVSSGMLPAPAEPRDVLDAGHEEQNIYKWRDITTDFLEATKELSLGELLHDQLFGLFEAMSAIEMMDPKMDAGMSCNRNAGNIHTFQTAVESGHLKLEDLTTPEHIGIFDHTLSCFVTWLEGHSLAQTVFTNLYLHSPFEIRSPIQRAFAIAILKCIVVVKHFIVKAAVYEEEDFQPGTYNFKLCQEISEVRAGGMLREAEDDLQKVIRATKRKDSSTEAESEERALEHKRSVALCARIRFLRHFYMALVALSKQEITTGQHNLEVAKEQIDLMQHTIEYGEFPEEGKELMGFERLANQKLLPPTFPRYTELRSRSSTIAYFGELVDRLMLSTNASSISSYQVATEYFFEFSRHCTPCVLSRSVIQVLYQPLYTLYNAPTGGGRVGMTITSFQDLLRDACKSFIAPPALMNKGTPYNSPQIRECIDNFISLCSRPMSGLLQAYGHNRARQRDKICNLLEEFASIQEKADKLDTMLHSVSDPSDSGRPHMLYFSTWLLYYVLRLIVSYLLSGFELELYSAHEYPYIYWYLHELLFPWLSTCLHRADTCLLEHEHKNLTRGKKKASKGSRKRAAANRPYAKEIALYQGYTSMCSGYYKLAVALKMESKMVLPEAPFDTEHVRYDHRFAPLWCLVTPPIMHYSQYQEVYSYTAKSPSPDLFLLASKDFSRARQILESISYAPGQGATPSQGVGGILSTMMQEDRVSLISVCKNNGIVAAILAKDSTRKVDFEFSLHKTFPSIKLV